MIRLILLLTLMAALAVPVSAKNFYRYKNADGQITLIDQLTPEAIEAGYEVINEEGKLVQTVGPAKTLGELEDEKRKELEAKQLEREKQRQLRRDAELLRLFASTDDILRARDAAMLGIEQRTQLNNNEESMLSISLEDLQRQAANHERLGQAVPKKLLDDINTQEESILQRQRNKVLIEQDRQNLLANYEQDLIRFKELQAKRLAYRFQNDGQNQKDNSVLMMTCSNVKNCNDMWQLAQVYAQSKASGRLEVITDSIILTSAPKTDLEMGLSFSRLPSRNETQIILEVSCNNTDAGMQLCKSTEAKRMVDGFKNFVDTQLK